MNYNSFIAPCPLGNITLSQDQRRHRHLPQTQLPPLPGPEKGLVQAWGFLQGTILALSIESSIETSGPRMRAWVQIPLLTEIFEN